MFLSVLKPILDNYEYSRIHEFFRSPYNFCTAQKSWPFSVLEPLFLIYRETYRFKGNIFKSHQNNLQKVFKFPHFDKLNALSD